jgi:AcrR family transcriptional regulator
MTRKRDAAATREAILHSAQVAFTRAGYDGVGVREIAETAGVTAMLVNRYFGSKEQLFAEVVETAFSARKLLTDDPATLSRDVAKALLTTTEPENVDGFLLMLRSAANPRAAEILREAIERHFERHLTDLLEIPQERAALVLSLIAGVKLMRNVLGTTALNEADVNTLRHPIETAFESLLGTGGN